MALTGRTDEAAGGYVNAIDGLRALGVVFEVGMTSLDAVMLLGADRPETQVAAEDARTIFSRLGAKPLLERLVVALGSPQPA